MKIWWAHDQVGTTSYWAPELVKNIRFLLGPADIWAFGVILYELFGGVSNRVGWHCLLCLGLTENFLSYLAF